MQAIPLAIQNNEYREAKALRIAEAGHEFVILIFLAKVHMIYYVIGIDKGINRSVFGNKIMGSGHTIYTSCPLSEQIHSYRPLLPL